MSPLIDVKENKKKEVKKDTPVGVSFLNDGGFIDLGDVKPLKNPFQNYNVAVDRGLGVPPQKPEPAKVDVYKPATKIAGPKDVSSVLNVLPKPIRLGILWSIGIIALLIFLSIILAFIKVLL